MTDKIRLVCPQCSTINQFPAARLQDVPHCASCKSTLMNGTPLAADASTLQRHIQQSGIPVLVDFWAPWCGPCKMFAPVFSDYAKQAEPNLRLIKVDTEAQQQAAMQYQIRSIPTLALFKNGSEIARMSGAMNLPQLSQWVQQHLN